MGEASGWKVTPAGHEARCIVAPFTLYAWSGKFVGHGWQVTVDAEDGEVVVCDGIEAETRGPGLAAMQSAAQRALRGMLTDALGTLDALEARGDE